MFLRILDTYLYKEWLLTFLAVLLVLLLITFGTEATKLLAIAVEGKLPPNVLLEVLLLKIPPALEVILPLVALLSVMMAIGRLYQDQEMVILSSCGIAPNYFQKRLILFLVPLAFITGGITLVVTPWSFQQERALIVEAQVSSPLAALVPGKFNELPNNQGVFYAQSIEANGDLKSVWARLKTPEQDLLLMAPLGKFEWISGKLALVLMDGHSYQGLTAGPEVTVRAFKRFEGFLPTLQVSPPAPQRFEKSTLELWYSADLKDQALLQWRLVTPLSVVVLGLLALRLSKTGPREGRFAKIFLALVLYVAYNQLLVTAKEATGDGNWPLWLGLWVIPLLFLWFALTKWTLKITRPGYFYVDFWRNRLLKTPKQESLK
ncbi:MAG: LPS export ABC transporter permease LptF [Thiotrichales bacterium]|nr:LPS export ABC transporter permease LptF [Thiotrichales bacterium]